MTTKNVLYHVPHKLLRITIYNRIELERRWNESLGSEEQFSWYLLYKCSLLVNFYSFCILPLILMFEFSAQVMLILAGNFGTKFQTFIIERNTKLIFKEKKWGTVTLTSQLACVTPMTYHQVWWPAKVLLEISLLWPPIFLKVPMANPL